MIGPFIRNRIFGIYYLDFQHLADRINPLHGLGTMQGVPLHVETRRSMFLASPLVFLRIEQTVLTLVRLGFLAPQPRAGYQ